MATFTDALEMAQALGVHEFVAEALHGLGQTALGQGYIGEARRYGQASLASFEVIGHHHADMVKHWLDDLPLTDDQGRWSPGSPIHG